MKSDYAGFLVDDKYIPLINPAMISFLSQKQNQPSIKV